jgi:hypothetical protein
VLTPVTPLAVTKCLREQWEKDRKIQSTVRVDLQRLSRTMTLCIAGHDLTTTHSLSRAPQPPAKIIKTKKSNTCPGQKKKSNTWWKKNKKSKSPALAPAINLGRSLGCGFKPHACQSDAKR